MSRLVRSGFVSVAGILFTLQLQAAPIVDGKFSPSDGYTSGFSVSFPLDGGGTMTGGQLWLFQDPASGDVYAAFIQPKSLVDNTYGANAIGWGTKGHTLKDLNGSDKAEFKFTNTKGQVVLDVDIDYITEDPKSSKNYVSLGATGGDGAVISGSASSVLAAATSLQYNFDLYDPALAANAGLLTDSPATNGSYTPNPTYPDWIYDVVYEVRIAGSTFGTAGFGGLTIPLVHDSPAKASLKGPPVIGPPLTPPPPVPEPATLLLLNAGLVAMGGLAWRRKGRGAAAKN